MAAKKLSAKVKKIPLYTDSKVIARVRFGEVNKVEKDIKSKDLFMPAPFM